MKIKVFISLLGLLVLAAFTALSLAKKAETSPFSNGAVLAQEAGCFACHAESELEPRVNFRSSSSGAYASRSLVTIWEDGIDSSKTVKEWIREGVPASKRAKHEQLLIQMPAYGDGYMSEEEIDAVAAWVLAKGFALFAGAESMDMDLPENLDVSKLSRDELIVYGDRLSRQQACYQCHGEFGQGGIANFESFKGYIPGFYGEDFLELTAHGDRGEILQWIDHGRGLDIESGWKGRFAKRYIEGQVLDMPAYEKVMSESEKALLVEYLLLLNEMGPLDSEQFESIHRSIVKHLESEY